MRRRSRRAARWIRDRLPLVLMLGSLAALIFFGVRVVQIEKRLTREDVLRAAQISSDYDACVRSGPALHRFKRFVRGVRGLHKALYANAEATHQATPPGTDTYRTQIENLARLKAAVDDVSGSSLTDFYIPSAKECAQIRDARLRGLSGGGE